MPTSSQVPPDFDPKEMNSGLFSKGRPISLEGVLVTGKIEGICSQITIKQRYRNTEAQEIEAVYLFPMEEQAAICGFTVKLKDRVLRGEIEEKQQAFERYDEALSEGNSAFLMEQVRPDIFTISVGRIPSQETVEIEITYVAEFQYEGNAIRWMLPTTVSPRYIPSHQAQEEPHLVETLDAPRQSSVPYGLQLELEVRIPSGLRHIESPSHPIRVSLEEDHAIVSLSQRETAMDRDIVIQIEPRKPHQPFAQVACTADGDRFAMLHFRPDPDGAPIQPSEVFFVLDCSGSMYGSSIEEATRALALCVRSLSEGDSFQIVRFGSSFEKLWPQPVPFNQEHLDEASEYIKKIDADLGGTELAAPLQSIYDQPLDPKRQRQIILLTDGEVSNESEVISLCRKGRPARVFSFGIGEGVSQHLVKGVARVSNGAAEFITSGERIEPKVLRTFSRLNTPIFDKIGLDWGETKASVAPKELPPIFAGEGMTVFAKLNKEHAPQVTLQADQQSWSLDLDFEKVERNSPIPTLWARHAIRDLEDGGSSGSQQRRAQQEETQKDKLLKLSKTFGLMSSVASYIAVEERPDHEKSHEPVALRRIPIALTKNWGETTKVRSVLSAMSVPAGGPSLRMAMAPPMASPVALGALANASPPPPPKGAIGGMGGMSGMAFGGAPPSLGGSFDAMPNEPMRELQKKKAAPKRRKEEAKLRDEEDETFDQPELKMESLEEAEQTESASFKTSKSLEDHVMDLLLTQRADGSFPDSGALRDWLGAQWSAVQARATQNSALVVYTLVALALLRTKAAAQRNLWTRAEQKAQRWLDQQSDLPDVQDLL
ncbi:MAG: VWA domain-containing protein [Myxococcales bacterium]|nr:VWA domain-containing protein [Myxococcales bacterium]